MEDFITAVREGKPLSSDAATSPDSHLMAFAAEKSRIKGRVISRL